MFKADIATVYRRGIEVRDQSWIAYKFLIDVLGINISYGDVVAGYSDQRAPDVLVTKNGKAIGLELTRITNSKITTQFKILEEINAQLLQTMWEDSIPYQITGSVGPNLGKSRSFVGELKQFSEENKQQIATQIAKRGRAYFKRDTIPRKFGILKSAINNLQFWPNDNKEFGFSMSYSDNGESVGHFTKHIENRVVRKGKKQYQVCDELYLLIYEAETYCHDLKKALVHCKLWLKNQEWPFKNIYFLESREEGAEWIRLL